MLAHLADASIRSYWHYWRALLCWPPFEHAVWTAVVCGMLALFFFGEFLPRLSLPNPN